MLIPSIKNFLSKIFRCLPDIKRGIAFSSFCSKQIYPPLFRYSIEIFAFSGPKIIKYQTIFTFRNPFPVDFKRTLHIKFHLTFSYWQYAT